MPTQLALVNEALAQVGTRSNLTTLAGNLPEQVYANALYAPIRDFLLAEGDYDFSLVGTGAVAAAGIAFAPWTLAYSYPSDALRIRQLVPASYDALDPRSIEWNISGQGGTKYIFTRETLGTVIYTKAVGEALWEPLFSEAFVRMLASALQYALKNSAEGSKLKLEEALSFAGVASMRDE